jgi:hypothetical protein
MNEEPTKQEIEEVYFSLRSVSERYSIYGASGKLIVKVINYWMQCSRDLAAAQACWKKKRDSGMFEDILAVDTFTFVEPMRSLASKCSSDKQHQYNNIMTNNIVSVGDIFMNSNEIYRVTYVQQSKTFPDNPYFEVDVWVAGSGWEDHDDGFLHCEVKYNGLTFFKATEY